MGTTRKLERGILRHRFGTRYLSDLYRERRWTPPKKRCAFIRAIINLYKLLTNKL